jgi:hypothetical protein
VDECLSQVLGDIVLYEEIKDENSIKTTSELSPTAGVDLFRQKNTAIILC